MNTPEVHIGKAIENRIKEVGMTKAEFGRRINTSRQNVNTLLRKSSLDTNLLQKISSVLAFNFLSLYLGDMPSDPTAFPLTLPPQKTITTTNLTLSIHVQSQRQLLELCEVLKGHGYLTRV